MEIRCYEDVKALAQQLGLPAKDLIAQHSLADPFYAGVPASQEQAEWFAALWRRFEFGDGVHLRRLHYFLVSQDPPILMRDGSPYLNTEECSRLLNAAAKYARNLRLVPPGAFVDRRNDDPIPSPTVEDKHGYIAVDNEGEFESFELPSLPDLPQLTLVSPSVPQRYRIEIWCEKSTMNDILLPIHRRYGVTLQICTGEVSATRCYELVDRVLRDRRPTRILYVSDFDPAGMSMPVAAARKIEHRLRLEGLDLDIELQPVVLTHDQCVQYRLPRTPIKESERRAARFEARFGDGATELDALEALHPGELAAVLRREISRYYDEGLSLRIQRAKWSLEEECEQITQEVHDEFADERASIESDYADIARRYNDEMRNIRERRESLSGRILERLQEESPDVDDYEWPEPAEGDENPDPLFNSARDYVTQIHRYKRHQGKPIDPEPIGRKAITLTCEMCGKSFEAKQRNRKYCSQTCNNKACNDRKQAA
jgi:hypothetical protein